jgi:indolepyruvate ferredoxin oxidoreductase beta subunit
MVMVGAASAFLPIKTETMEKTIEKMFAHKDAAVVEANKKAYKLGKNAAK